MQKKFCTRRDAGVLLAEHLKEYTNRTDVMVLALPNNGIPIAYEIATALDVDLDVITVCRIDVPEAPEVTLGAVAPHNIFIQNPEIIDRYHIPPDVIEKEKQQAYSRIAAWDEKFHTNTPIPELDHRTVILVDDGMETGATMRAAIAAIGWIPDSIVVAVPLVSKRVATMIQEEVDEVVTLITPQDPVNAAAWYDEAGDISDQEALDLLNRPRHSTLSKAGFYTENVTQ